MVRTIRSSSSSSSCRSYCSSTQSRRNPPQYLGVHGIVTRLGGRGQEIQRPPRPGRFSQRLPVLSSAPPKGEFVTLGGAVRGRLVGDGSGDRVRCAGYYQSTRCHFEFEASEVGYSRRTGEHDTSVGTQP